VLDVLVARAARVARFVRLCDEAAALGADDLPRCAVADGTVPGRAMPVALQGEPLAA
jgi:hypothetical protein